MFNLPQGHLPMIICPGTIIETCWHKFEKKIEKNEKKGQTSVFEQGDTENMLGLEEKQFMIS